MAQTWQVTSPDKSLSLQVDLIAGALTYTVTFNEQPVIAPSPLGILREDETFTGNLHFTRAGDITTIDESYTMLTGKQRQLRNHANERVLNFANDNDAPIQLILRAYDDGAAFRYRFPDENADTFTVTDEKTAFTIAGEGQFWAQPHDFAGRTNPAYETWYVSGVPIGTCVAPDQGVGWSFPALFETQQHWLMITESDVNEHYFGSHLKADVENNTYTLARPEADVALGIGDTVAHATLPWATPWRIIIIGESPATIVESSLVHHLATPCKIADTSWIKPGTASWSWWSDHASSRDYDKLKAFVDLAADMGWAYSLVDANWNIMEGGTLEQLIDYANTKGVGLLAWYNSGGPNNEVPEQPRDRMYDADIRRAEMAWLQKIGIKGIKVDFFQADKQQLIQQYLGILADGADHHLLINFHGCTVPRGWSRTWPNLMSMEGVRGAETYTFSDDYAENAPWHNVVLAFTRNVVGPMDYTPITFSDFPGVPPHITTNAHELALGVIFESGILHPADSVASYQAQPQAVRDFLGTLPSMWDETRFITGYPAQSIVLARRNGNTWYLAGINGQDKAISLNIPLSFLNDGTYDHLWIMDGTGRDDFHSITGDATSSDILEAKLAPYGGFAIRFTAK